MDYIPDIVFLNLIKEDIMPDITMCVNENCEDKESCYRYKAKPNWNQSYATFKKEDGNKCEHFLWWRTK